MSSTFTPRESGPSVLSREEYDQTWFALHRLVQDLSVVQKRLGTPLEKEGDCELVRCLAHEIRNKLQITQL